MHLENVTAKDAEEAQRNAKSFTGARKAGIAARLGRRSLMVGGQAEQFVRNAVEGKSKPLRENKQCMMYDLCLMEQLVI